MSETTPESAPEGVEQEAPELGDAGRKALQAERDARKAAERSAAELKTRLDQLEAANLSELEKAQKAAADAGNELAALRAENLKSRVALAKGLPVDLIDFLTGDTEEEVTAKADLLLSKINAPTTPKPDPSQGASGKAAAGTNADRFAEFLNAQLGN